MAANPLTAVLSAARAWRGVAEAKSRFGGRGAALVADGREFLHVHTPTRIDVRVTRAHAKAFRGDARVVLRRKPSDWLEVVVQDASDAEFAIAVARVAWRAAQDPAPRTRRRR